MDDMTPTPWPEPNDDPNNVNQGDRLWPNGAAAAWAFMDGGWVVFSPPSIATSGSGRLAGGNVAGENQEPSLALLAAARTAADEALSRLLAEMVAEVPRG